LTALKTGFATPASSTWLLLGADDSGKLFKLPARLVMTYNEKRLAIKPRRQEKGNAYD
jgi:hypothetical protein